MMPVWIRWFRWQNDARAEHAIANGSMIAHFRQGMMRTEAAAARSKEDDVSGVDGRGQRCRLDDDGVGKPRRAGGAQSFLNADVMGFAGFYTAMANGRGIRVKFRTQGPDGNVTVENVHHRKALVVLTPTGALRSATAHGARL